MTLAVVNARVWTGDPRRPWADAVVVRGERLAFVGSGAEARKLTRGAPNAHVLDAAGQFLAPAVVEAPGVAPGIPNTRSDIIERLHAAVTRPAADGTAGVLRAGEPANFVLIDRDLTRLAAPEIRKARIVRVVRRGHVLDEPVLDEP